MGSGTDKSTLAEAGYPQFPSITRVVLIGMTLLTGDALNDYSTPLFST